MQTARNQQITLPIRTLARLVVPWLAGFFSALATFSHAQDTNPVAEIRVEARRALGPTPRYLTGVALCDVNHEVYGGLYSQMIFGEHFAEPAMEPPIQGFTMWHGGWRCTDAGVAEMVWAWAPHDTAGQGADSSILLCDKPAGPSGEVSAALFLNRKQSRGCGLFLRASPRPAIDGGPSGLAVWLNGAAQTIELAEFDLKRSPPRRLLKRVPWPVPEQTWITLSAKWTPNDLAVSLNGQCAFQYDSSRELPRLGELWGLISLQRQAQFRSVQLSQRDTSAPVALQSDRAHLDQVSRHWRAIVTGTAQGHLSIATNQPLAGTQCQRVEFTAGQGEVGLENQGLHRWGMNWLGGREYEGEIWARSRQPAAIYAALESADGSRVYAEQALALRAGVWQKLAFKLTPSQTDGAGRFAIKLKSPGRVDLGYVFLEPGVWGRYQDLPVRRDIVEEMLANGVSAMRFSATLAWMDGYGWMGLRGYHWKMATGPRALRPPFEHVFYPYSSGGWSWLELLDLCDAAGMWPIPDFSMTETPQDLLDFIEYANGPAESPWGRRRAEHGHPAPFNLRQMQLGNERNVDERYWEQFKPLAEVIWSKHPEMILIVGGWGIQSETDPKAVWFRQLLQLAKRFGAEIWFDSHLGTERPDDLAGVATISRFSDTLGRLANGAKFKVVVLELNAVQHGLTRALATAQTLGGLAELGDAVPLVCGSNALEPEAYCDNGWSQGLVFFNSHRAWSQPPAYVMRMITSSRLPWRVQARVTGAQKTLYANAETDEARTNLTLRVLNVRPHWVNASLRLEGFEPRAPEAEVELLTGAPDEVNSSDRTDAVAPTRSPWRHQMHAGQTAFTFAPNSFTVLRFR